MWRYCFNLAKSEGQHKVGDFACRGIRSEMASVFELHHEYAVMGSPSLQIHDQLIQTLNRPSRYRRIAETYAHLAKLVDLQYFCGFSIAFAISSVLSLALVDAHL